MKPGTWNLMALKFGPHPYSPVDAQQIAQSLRMIGHNLQKPKTSYIQMKLWTENCLNEGKVICTKQFTPK